MLMVKTLKRNGCRKCVSWHFKATNEPENEATAVRNVINASSAASVKTLNNESSKISVA